DIGSGSAGPTGREPFYVLGTELSAALAQSAVVRDAALAWRMALHAVSDSNQIRAPLDWVAHHLRSIACVCLRIVIMTHRSAVDRIGYSIAHRLYRAKICDDCRLILWQERLEKRYGHHGELQARHARIRWTLAMGQRPFDGIITPIPNTGLAIRRDVRCRPVKGWDGKGDTAAGKCALHDGRTVGVLGSMAISASHDCIYEIIAALHSRLRAHRGCACQTSYYHQRPTDHCPLLIIKWQLRRRYYHAYSKVNFVLLVRG